MSSWRIQLWHYCEARTEAIDILDPSHKLDVSLATVALAGFIASMPASVRAVAGEAKSRLFGHAADFHANVTGVAPDDEGVDDAVLLPLLHSTATSAPGAASAQRRRDGCTSTAVRPR